METHPDSNSTSELGGETQEYLEGTQGCVSVRIWDQIRDFCLQNSKLKDVLVHLL